MTETKSPDICSVCGDAVEAHTESYCHGCGRLFHLNQREDLPGRDCGIVAISDEHLALEFLCNPCLSEPEPAETALDDVLDLGEAARAAGVSETQLVEAANSARIAHRRTGSGTLLFERAAVDAFRQVQS